MFLLQAILSLAILIDSSPQNIYADGWNKKSLLTSAQAIEIPGMTLEPGTYVIQLEEGSSRRNIVQVLTEDGSKLVTRLIAVPDYRARETDEAFTYHKIPGEGLRVLQSWYYPGDLNGLEFVYPKARAKEIAKATDSHVVASNGKEVKQSAIVAITPSGVEVLIDEAPKADVARQKPGPK